MKKILQIFIFVQAELMSAGVTFPRHDLFVLGNLPCKQMDTYDFWEEEVFDSQVSIGIYQVSSQYAEAQVHAIIDQQMRAESHRGYYKGECAKDKFYVITVPSPVPLSETNLSSKLNSFCTKIFFDQVSIRGLSEETNYPLKSSENKSSTISCELGNTKQEWFLVPPKNWRKLMLGSTKPPKSQSTKSSRDSLTNQLSRWLQDMRASEQKKTILPSAGLDLVAKSLNASQQILHNRKSMELELLNLRKKEEFQNTKILLEDRVEAGSLSEAKDLLWWSPRHRNLILSDKINRFGLDLQTNQGFLKISIVGSD